MMPSANTLSSNLSPFGKLGSTAAFLPIPLGNVTVKLTRVLGASVDYQPPPVGQGFKGLTWERDALGGAATYVFKADTADLSGAVSLAQWRSRVAQDFPDHTATKRHSVGTRRLAGFAQALLTFTADLHRAKWRLGLLDPDNLYLIERDGTEVFLPDLGFAWLGAVSVARPDWLRTEARDASLWAEDRMTRQCSAPSQYQKHFTEAAWNDLVQRDLRLVARLFRFVLTGDVAGAEPPNARRCPVWRVILDVEAGRYVDTESGLAAENVLSALQSGLKVSSAPVADGSAGASPSRALWWGVALLLGVILGGSLWFSYQRSKQPPENKRGPVSVAVRDAINDANKLPDVMVRAREAIALGQRSDLSPEDRKAIVAFQARTRAELLEEIRKSYAAAQKGAHLPLRTRELLELFKQLPEAP